MSSVTPGPSAPLGRRRYPGKERAMEPPLPHIFPSHDPWMDTSPSRTACSPLRALPRSHHPPLILTAPLPILASPHTPPAMPLLPATPSVHTPVTATPSFDFSPLLSPFHVTPLSLRASPGPAL